MNDYLIYKESLGDTPEFLKKYLDLDIVKRLKGISLLCGMDYASKYAYDFKCYISRYDHSLDVALIVWKLTHDKKATLAGLFHDISTPVFSHVIDYMNKDYIKQESTEEKTLETYVNRCIDNIIKHELIEGVTDVNSFAEFALPLEFDDERLVEGIGQGAAMTYDELSDEEKSTLKNFSMRVYATKEKSNGDCSRRIDNIEIWSGILLELVHNRIRQRLKEDYK